MDNSPDANHNSIPFNSQLNASSLNILGAQATPPSTRTLGLTESMIVPSVEPNLAEEYPSGVVRSQLESFGENFQDNRNGEHNNLQGHSAERLRVIWGTNIVISDAISSFKNFLHDFTLAHRSLFEKTVVNHPNDYEPLYPKLLEQIYETEIRHLDLDCANLRAFPATSFFSRQLVHYPNEMISLMDVVVNEEFENMYPDHPSGSDPIQVRPYNVAASTNLRDLNPSDIDKLISVKGMVIRVSNIMPDMRVAFFACQTCGSSMTVENIRGFISEPQQCPQASCGSLNSMCLVHNRCLFSDKQIIKIQETPDAIPDGQTPHSVTLFAYDTLVDFCRPGDRVEFTGIFRSAPIRANVNQRKIKSIFRTYIDVVHCQVAEQHDFRSTPLSTLEKSQLISLKESFKSTSELFSTLAGSLAPSVWGLENVKKGLLLQLFGGVGKILKVSGTKYRGDINILLAGDPGVSKSQLLQYVHKLSSRGVYTSGKGSSAVGLTAYITRDADSNQLVLESGALVLSDGGVCCIDEFDKMSDETRTILHEVMEQQTISVAKAGIITTLNARTSILASANPLESKYNAQKSIVENLSLPPPILSRFDLIFLLLDNAQAEADKNLGKHIVSLYSSKVHHNDYVIPQNIESRVLNRYIAYAKTLKPVMSEAASREIALAYVGMRKANGGSAKTIAATTRQLESLIRLSEAHARMRLSNAVEVEDTTEACRLIKDALLSFALDPLTGKIDMDLVNTGQSSASREQRYQLKETLKRLLNSLDQKSIQFSQLVDMLRMNFSPITVEKQIFDALDELEAEEFVKISGNRRQNNSLVMVIN